MDLLLTVKTLQSINSIPNNPDLIKTRTNYPTVEWLRIHKSKWIKQNKKRENNLLKKLAD
jgi:hypothetical protein